MLGYQPFVQQSLTFLFVAQQEALVRGGEVQATPGALRDAQVSERVVPRRHVRWPLADGNKCLTGRVLPQKAGGFLNTCENHTQPIIRVHA